MKTREQFDEIRAQKREVFSLRFRMILMVQAELLFCIGLAYLCHWIANGILKLDIPLWLEFIIITMIVGSVLTLVMSRMFFNPIKKLRGAMERVADGDLTVKLEPDESSSKEIREIYAGFNLMTHELSSTEILKTDFVSNVSHEIKTPVNAIEGYAMLIQDSDNITEAEREEYVDKIVFNTRRLSSLVGNILLLSKIDSQSIVGSLTEFRLDEQIRQSIMMLEPEWEKKEIEFDVEMEEVTIKQNEPLLYHVWYNLIGNAIKFDPWGGAVKIRLSADNGMIVFTVEDNGPGISHEAQKHIFDKFYQGDSSHKDEGNGLGLSLVKKILSVSNGEISVENKSEGGCRFTVILNHTKKINNFI